MNTRLLECIINGSIVINSLEVLRPWVTKFPNHPNLLLKINRWCSKNQFKY
jgi:hypothetical protein